MFNQNRIYRVFRLINLLKSKPSKTIKRISEIMDVSERSLYRYIELLEDVGFVIEKDITNRYSIESKYIESFTPEETELINQSISTGKKGNPLVKSIKLKLITNKDLNVISEEIVASNASKLISIIKEAIENKKQIVLEKYQSANSESITDRLIEPIHFSDNYASIIAFEVETRLNKSFKIERIGNIKTLENPFEFEDQHELFRADIFGFNGIEKRIPIKLKLSMRAMLWLKDDYPKAAAFLNPIENGEWILDTEVYSMKPVQRMIRSMPDDIIVIE